MPTPVTIATATASLGSTFNVLDNDVADTLISATSEPASPQYSQTIVTADIPSDASVTDYAVILCIEGRNTDNAAAHQINIVPTLNGTNMGSSKLVNLGANNYWQADAFFYANAIANNDVIGIKMWSNVANKIDYRAITVYIIPRTYVNPVSDEIATLIDTQLISGAITGVTYVQNDTPYGCVDPINATINNTEIAIAPQWLGLPQVNSFNLVIAGLNPRLHSFTIPANVRSWSMSA